MLTSRLIQFQFRWSQGAPAQHWPGAARIGRQHRQR
jgi:hypothetical protein